MVDITPAPQQLYKQQKQTGMSKTTSGTIQKSREKSKKKKSVTFLQSCSSQEETTSGGLLLEGEFSRVARLTSDDSCASSPAFFTPNNMNGNDTVFAWSPSAPTEKTEPQNGDYFSTSSRSTSLPVVEEAIQIQSTNHAQSLGRGSHESRAYSLEPKAPGPSCLALKNAVLALYRLDDFEREYLSEGFFSDVYKNVLLKRTGYMLRAVIADFGLACRIPREEGKILDQVGTPYWMAPECLKEEFYNEKADVFSYGVICCQMIARIDADPDKGFPRTPVFGLDYVLFGEMCPEDTPDELLRLAFTCCLMDPKSRPSFDLAVKRALICLRRIQAHTRSKSKAGTFPSGFSDGSKLSRSFSDAGLSAALTGGLAFSKDRLGTSKEKLEGDFEDEKSKASRKASRILAKTVAAEDPYYEPGRESTNPFAVHKKFRSGKKIPLPSTVEKLEHDISMEYSSESMHHRSSLLDTPENVRFESDAVSAGIYVDGGHRPIRKSADESMGGRRAPLGRRRSSSLPLFPVIPRKRNSCDLNNSVKGITEKIQKLHDTV